MGAPAEVNRDQQQPLHVSPHWDLVRQLWNPLVADNPMWLSTMLCGEPDWTHRGVTGPQTLLQETAEYKPVSDPEEVVESAVDPCEGERDEFGRWVAGQKRCWSVLDPLQRLFARLTSKSVWRRWHSVWLIQHAVHHSIDDMELS